MSDQPVQKKVILSNRAIISANIITAPGLGEDILSGKRGYMNRSFFPPKMMLDGEAITDPVKMRQDYHTIPDLVREQKERSSKTNFVIFRTEIPMNLGVGWFEKGQWYLHPDDVFSAELLGSVPLIDIYPDAGFIRPRVIDLDGEIPECDYAILTSCLGQNEFDVDLAVQLDSDPRHLTQHRYHPSGKKIQDGNANDKDNKAIRKYARLFKTDRQEYLEQLREYIEEVGWTDYDRSVMVIGDKDLELHSFTNTTPDKIFEAIREQTNSDDITVFNTVFGGSFSFGLVRDGKVYEVGLREPKNYNRPPGALWLGCLEIEKSYGKKILDEGATLL
jgi:hypothetical protein